MSDNPLVMSVITAYASRVFRAAAGVWPQSRLTIHRAAPLIHAILVSTFVLCPASCQYLGAEGSEPPPATNHLEETNSGAALHGFLQLQEQLRATQLAIERNSLEAKEAAAQNAEALSKGLQSMLEAFSVERAHELEAVQRSNKYMLVVGGAIAAMGLLALLIMTYFQWRTSSRLAEISAALPTALGPGPSAAVPVLGPGDSRTVEAGPAEQSSRRLLAGKKQRRKRIHGLQQEARAESESGEGTSSSGGSGESAASSNSDSGAKSVEVAGTNAQARIAELLTQAHAMSDVGNMEAALACFDKVLALDPDHSQALVKKGAVLERLRRLNEAIECYDRAIAVDDTMTSAYLHKGGLCNRLERFKEALECYEKAMQMHDK
jgi:tetratricopeptide (TPR) repeat protein